MAKLKPYVCQGCGTEFSQWSGQCVQCKAWNSLSEQVILSPKSARVGYAGQIASTQSLKSVGTETLERIACGSSELDRCLGGGIVPGQVILLGGDPGIGKSTLLLQVCAHLAQTQKVLYVSGEESVEQVAARARRLQLPSLDILMNTQTEVGEIIAAAKSIEPRLLIIDSIQTLYLESISGAPGGVTQVRESTALLARFAKQSGTSVFIIGHVTKSGDVAGPRVLEHIVDTVLFLEGESDSPYRTLRSIKNRFGRANELGIFAMTEEGLKGVKNPSSIFLSKRSTPSPGSVTMVLWEGSRPLLIECQALVDSTVSSAPKRLSMGVDPNRLSLLLAILHRHAGVATHDKDIFINVVGGVKVSETSADLALLVALLSSIKNKALPLDCIVFGELGLGGEIRPISNGQERLKEAAKHGFKRALVPTANLSKHCAEMELLGVSTLPEAIKKVQEWMS